MNSLTQEQIARVFAMYYPIKPISYKEWSEERGYWYPFRNPSTSLYAIGEIEKGMQNFKLPLRPLSAISDEDAIEVAKMHYGAVHVEMHVDKQPQYILHVQAHIHSLLGKGNNGSACYIYSFLIQRGYAVPLFIGPGHPDNGKDAIQLGLAIDSSLLSSIV